MLVFKGMVTREHFSEIVILFYSSVSIHNPQTSDSQGEALPRKGERN